MNEFIIELQAKLDQAKSINNLNGSDGDIAKLQKKLETLKLQAELDQDSVKELADDIEKLLNQKIVISNIGVDTKQANKTGQQTVEAFNKGVSQGLDRSSNILNNFKKTLEKMGMDSKVVDTVADRIQKLNVQIDSLNESKTHTSNKDILSIDISGVDNLGQAIKLTEQYNMSTGELIKEIDAVSTAQQKFNSSTSSIKKAKNVFADYTAKIEQFKSTNGNILSGLSVPLSEFESKLSGLKNGTSTVDEVINSYRMLNAEASKITSNLSAQFNKVDSAVRNIAKGDETIASLRADFKGLANSPKEVNSELSKCEKLLLNVKNIESQEGRTANWSAAYKEWENSIDSLRAKLSTLKKEQSNSASTQVYKTADLRKNDIAYMTKVSNTIDKQMTEIQKMATAKGWKSFDVKGIEEADGKIKKLALTVTDAEGAVKRLNFEREKLQGNGKIQDGLMQTGDVQVIKTAAQAQAEFAINTQKTNDKLAEQVKDIQLSMEGKNRPNLNYDWQIDEEIKKLRNLGFTDNEVTKKVKVLTDAHAELKRVMNSNDFDSVEAKNRAIVKSDNERTLALNQVKTAYKELKTDASQYYNLNKQNKLSNEILDWLHKNSSASKDAKQSLNEYYRELNNGRVPVSRLDYIQQQLDNIDTTQRGLGRLGKNLKDQFSEAYKSFTQWLSISSGIMFLVSKTKDSISELKNLDTILTEISKTSDLTEQQLSKLGNSAFDSASKYGKEASDYLTGVQEMFRAGYKNAAQMSELSVLAQAAGDMDSATANDYLIASDAAYNLKGNIEDLNRVLDGQNMITNNAAVSMVDMAQATSEAASIASQYGVTIEELSSLIAVATSKTRESGSETGTALKALFVNLQDTTSKPIRDAFDAVNISMTEIINGSENLKTPIQLLKELSDAFISLDEGDVRRANILSDIGGKHHANTLSAILSDWSSFEKMLDLYSQGMGSAAEEAEKSANNWEGSLNRLSNTWTKTISNIVNSDGIISVINVFNNLLSVIDSVTDKFGSFGTIGLGAGLFAGVKNVGGWKNVSPICFEIADYNMCSFGY